MVIEGFNLPAPIGFEALDPHRPVTVYFRHMPHWRQEGATYFVTFRLADALPQMVQQQLRQERATWEAQHPPPRSDQEWDEYARIVFTETERCQDKGYGVCHFREARVAALLEDALMHFQDRRYLASCWVIMPNHVHLVIRPFVGHKLEKILQVCKGYVAHQINRALGTKGEVWQQESYDRIVRDEEHLWRVIQYIGANPRQAGIETTSCWRRWVHPDWEKAGWGFRSW